MISKLIKDISWFLLEHGIRTICSIISSILIINYFSPQNYGILSISLSIYTVLQAISSLGLDSILLKKLIELTDYSVIAGSYKLRFICSILISTICLLALLFLDNQWLVILVILIVSLYFDSFRALKELAFSKKKYTSIVYSNSIASLIQLISVALLVYFKSSLYWFALPFLLKSLTFISILFSLEWGSAKNTLYIPKKIDLKLLKEGIPLMIASIAGLIYAVQDQWMIGIFMTNEDVGIYSAGVKFVLILLILPTIVTNVLYHKIINLKESNYFDSYMQSLYSILFYFGLVLYIGMYFFSKYIIDLIFPETYESSKEVLIVYSIILIMAFFQSLNNKLLILFNNQKLIMQRVLLSLIFNLLFNLYLINNYGIVGAALATVLSEFIVLISYSFNKSTRNIFIFQIKAINPIHIKNIFIISK